MLHKLLMAISLAASVGCGGSQSTSTSTGSVQMKAETTRELQEEKEREAIERERRRPVGSEPEMPPEELAVEMYQLPPGETVQTDGGISIKTVSGTAPFEFRLERGGEVVVARDASAPLYAEGVAFGQLFVFSKFGDSTQVTLRSDAPGAPLTPDQAATFADRELESRIDCEGSRRAPLAEDNGTVTVVVQDDGGGEACRIVIGRFTHSVVDI